MIAAGSGDLAVANSIDLKENPTTGWTLARIPLSEYKAKGGIQFEIRLSAIHNDDTTTWSVPLDNIRVRDLAPADLHIVSAYIPKQTSPSDTLTCTAHMENYGTEATKNATATLKINGENATTIELEEIAPNAFADIKLDYVVPLNAPETLEVELAVNIDGDVNTADNKAEGNVAVARKPYATVTDLEATLTDGLVTLKWTEPQNEASAASVIKEDFENEDYTLMSISGCGEWTVYDGDGKATYNVFSEIYNPYQTKPIAFQLFNREEAGVPSYYWEDAEAHSGNNFMLAPSAAGAENDNWLISPVLSGNEQTVTFWAKSYMSAWPETFDIYYSTTDNSREAFTNEVEYSGEFIYGDCIPEVWTEYSVVIPAGAKYFAIHHNSYDTLALFIDDVTYEGLPSVPEDLAIEGYHVFRNGEQITEELVASTTYTDNPKDDSSNGATKHFEYSVVPVYNYGPVAESNKVSVDITTSGIKEVSISSLGSNAIVYDLRGIRISTDKLTEGIYILTDGEKAEKVILR